MEEMEGRAQRGGIVGCLVHWGVEEPRLVMGQFVVIENGKVCLDGWSLVDLQHAFLALGQTASGTRVVGRI